MGGMAKHRTRELCLIGQRLFEQAEEHGVEPEALAADARERNALVVYEDAMFEKYEREREYDRRRSLPTLQ